MPGNLLFSHLRTIFAVKMLNFCVRYGYRCVHLAFITRLPLSSHSKLDNNFFSRLSFRPISISPLNISLCLHSWPIYLLVFKGSPDCSWKSHLEGDFTLRCLQRLFLPHLATQLCHWRDNWFTIGVSIPVLSYWGQLFSNFLRPRQIGTELSHDVLNPARVPL